MTELFEMDIREIQAGLMNGEFSAREVAESALARIAEQDKEVHAYLETTEEAALDAAEKIDMVLESGVDLSVIGPLAGIPVA